MTETKKNTYFYQTEQDMTADLLDLVWLGFYFLFATLLFPQFALFFGGAVEQDINITKYTLYNSTLAVVFVIAVLVKFTNLELYKRGIEIEIPFFLHDPEFSILRRFRIIRDVRIMILGSIIIGLLTALSGIAQTSLPQLEQQVSGTAQFIFDIWPASPSETMLLGAFLGFISVVFYLLYRFVLKQLRTRFRMNFNFHNPAVFYVFAVIILILFAFFGSFYGEKLHFYRYGDSEINIGIVKNFWMISGTLIALTGSIIPALVQHDVNNGVLSATSIFSESVTQTYIVIGLFIASVALALLIISHFQKKKHPKSYRGEPSD